MIPIRNDRSMTATAAAWPAPRLQADVGARLSHADYEAWLLPPAPRNGVERVVHALSLAAGIGAVTLFSVGLWLIT